MVAERAIPATPDNGPSNTQPVDIPTDTEQAAAQQPTPTNITTEGAAQQPTPNDNEFINTPGTAAQQPTPDQPTPLQGTAQQPPGPPLELGVAAQQPPPPPGLPPGIGAV